MGRPQKVRIRIASAGKSTYWYADKIGKEYDAYIGLKDEDRNLDGTDFVDAEDYELGSDVWHQFAKYDCEVVKEY